MLTLFAVAGYSQYTCDSVFCWSLNSRTRLWDIIGLANMTNLSANISDTNYYSTSITCTNSTSHICDVNGTTGFPDFSFAFTDIDTDTHNTTTQMLAATNISAYFQHLIGWANLLNVPTWNNGSGTSNITTANILAWFGNYSAILNDSSGDCAAGYNCVGGIKQGNTSGEFVTAIGLYAPNATAGAGITLTGQSVAQTDYSSTANVTSTTGYAITGQTYSGMGHVLTTTTGTINNLTTAQAIAAVNTSDYYNQLRVNCSQIMFGATKGSSGICDGTDDGSAGGGINGSGTTNYLARWNSTSTINASSIYDDGTNVNITANLNLGNGAPVLEITNQSGNALFNVTTAANFTGPIYATAVYDDGALLISDGNTGWDNSYGFLTNITDNDSVAWKNINDGLPTWNNGSGTSNITTANIMAWFGNYSAQTNDSSGDCAAGAVCTGGIKQGNNTAEFVTAIGTYAPNGTAGAGITVTSNSFAQTDYSSVANVSSTTGTAITGQTYSGMGHVLTTTTGTVNNITTTDAKNAVNTTDYYNQISVNCSQIMFGATKGSSGICDGTDDGSGAGLNGTGYLNYLVRWNSTTSLNSSSIYDDGTNVNISANLNLGNGVSVMEITNRSGYAYFNTTTGANFSQNVYATGFYDDGVQVITAAGVPAAETDAAHDSCAEIAGCVVGAITDGNTGWDNSYGFVTNTTMNKSVNWSGVDNIPAGFADGVDDTGAGAADGTGGWVNDSTTTATSLNVCVGTTGCTNRIHTRETSFSYLPLFERYVASTVNPYGTFFVRVESTTGTGGNGFGPFINMQHESSAGTVYNLASFGAVVDSASNRGALVFNTYDTAETEAMRVTHDGNLSMTRGGKISTAGSIEGNLDASYVQNAPWVTNLTMNKSSSWTDLENYPSACPANTYLTGLGDAVTCQAVLPLNISDLSTYLPNVTAGAGITVTGQSVAQTDYSSVANVSSTSGYAITGQTYSGFGDVLTTTTGTVNNITTADAVAAVNNTGGLNMTCIYFTNGAAICGT